jgi:hypothetical protein
LFTTSTGDNHMAFRNGSVFVGAALSVFLLSSSAQAHWCNDLWGSAYNIVVRPESDTVTVPSSGSASLSVFVQNNMGYALPSFQLVADIGGTAVTATRQTQKVSGTLLPGEKAKYTLTISKSGGGSVAATDINFSVHFGNSGQDNMYGSAAATGAKAAMIRKTDGSLFPTPPPPGLGLGSSMTQGTQLLNAAVADFGDTNSGLDKLLQLYCAGRGSWNTGSSAVTKSNCTDTSSTVCPTSTPSASFGSKYDYMHLWAAVELAARKSGLGARTAVLRKRLQCGVNDANTGFAGFALMMLGYLGEDAGARTFIEGKTSTSGDLGTIAKAALLLMGSASDMTKYKADVVTGASSSSIFVKAACAASLGIAAKDDATVTSALIPLAKWTEPDTSDNGQAIYSAQLLNLVAWDRRGWGAKAGDTGAVTFYGETASAAGGASGAGGSTGAGGSGAGGSGVGGAGAGLGGASGNRDAGTVNSDAGTASSGGSQARGGSSSAGGASAVGGALAAGGASGTTARSGGSTASAGAAGGSTVAAGGTTGSAGGGQGGSSGSSGGASAVNSDPSTGCKCNLGGRNQEMPSLYAFALAGLAWLGIRRRKQRRG